MCGTLLGYYPLLFHTLHIAHLQVWVPRKSRTPLGKSYHSSYCRYYCIPLFICHRRTDAGVPILHLHAVISTGLVQVPKIGRQICAASRILGRRRAQLAKWLGNHERLRSRDRMFLKVCLCANAHASKSVSCLYRKTIGPRPFLADKIGWKSGTRDLSSIQGSRTGSGQNWVDRRCGVPGIPDSRDYGILFAKQIMFSCPFYFLRMVWCGGRWLDPKIVT